MQAYNGSSLEITITEKVLLVNMLVRSFVFNPLLNTKLNLSVALEPRFLGGTAIITRSFARIRMFFSRSFLRPCLTCDITDETNCKKQGLLPLTFSSEKDYDRVQPTDKVDLIGVKELAPGSKITMRLTHKDGSNEDIELSHSFNAGQIEWHRAGSGLSIFLESEITLTQPLFFSSESYG